MSQPYVGEIRIVGFNFAPVGWAFCDGAIFSIADYTTLFTLLGTTYGGDGESTFAVPDFRGRIPIHQGQGQGLSHYTIGSLGGAETVTLQSTQMPPHAHTIMTGGGGARTTVPTGNLLASGEADIYNHDTQQPMALSFQQLAAAGSSQPHENLQPYLCVNFIIALVGYFPSQG